MNIDERDKEISVLYRDAARDGPSPALDQIILRAAAAATQPEKPVKRWWPRWGVPLQLAATVMLVGMLVVMIERGTDLPPLPASSRSTPIGSAERAGGEPEARAESSVAARPSNEALPPRPASAPQGSIKPRLDKPAGAPSIVESAPAARSAPAPAPALADSAGAGVMAKRDATVAEAAQGSKASEIDVAEGRVRAREDWLARIQRLLDQGKLKEAQREFDAFIKSNPEYPLPEGLKKRFAP